MKNYEIRYDEGRKKGITRKGVKIGPKKDINFIGLRI